MTEHTSKDPIKAIKALLTDELHIDAVHFPVDVKSENGSIIIEGTVEKISQKKKAVLSHERRADKGPSLRRLCGRERVQGAQARCRGYGRHSRPRRRGLVLEPQEARGSSGVVGARFY